MSHARAAATPGQPRIAQRRSSHRQLRRRCKIALQRQSHYGLWLFGIIVIVIVKASSKWLLGLRACTLTIV